MVKHDRSPALLLDAQSKSMSRGVPPLPRWRGSPGRGEDGCVSCALRRASSRSSSWTDGVARGADGGLGVGLSASRGREGVADWRIDDTEAARPKPDTATGRRSMNARAFAVIFRVFFPGGWTTTLSFNRPISTRPGKHAVTTKRGLPECTAFRVAAGR